MLEIDVVPWYQSVMIVCGPVRLHLLGGHDDVDRILVQGDLALRGLRGCLDFTELDEDEEPGAWYRRHLEYQVHGYDDKFTLSHGDLELTLTRAELTTLLRSLEEAEAANAEMHATSTDCNSF
jgi:hypothetical protein